MKRILQILFFLICFHGIVNAQSNKDSYSSSSALSSGLWFKIAVTSDGVYKIEYSKLKQLGLTYPSNPKIYGNNAGLLSYYNDDPKPDDLNELSISLSIGSDGVFNEGDYLLFFAQGTGRWKYNQKAKSFDFIKHNYSDTAFYFLTYSPTQGKLIQLATEPSQPPNFLSSSADALFATDPDDKNLLKSGREWYSQISNLHVDPGFSGVLTNEDINYELRVAARAPTITSFSLSEGSTLKKTVVVQGVNMFDNTGTHFQISDSSGTIKTASNSPVYDIRFLNNGQNGVEGYLDRIKIHARKTTSFTGIQTAFCDSKSVSPGRVTSFILHSSNPDPVIWDVTNPFKVRQMQTIRTGENISFKCATDSLKQFIAFQPGTAVIPTIRSAAVPNQDLHASGAADMIIVTHPLFISYAEKLAAIHLKNDGLITQIVTIGEIYNEFSGGIPDISAIRNFLRMKYLKQKGTSHPLKYLLLFGDGSFENKKQPPANPNFIPTYQSQNSNIWVSSFASDDYYGLLDDGEGEAFGTEDIGIGRLPVSDTVQAGIVLTKIKRYLDPSNMGDWKNVICLTADDEDGNTHLSDAEGLSSVLKDSVPVYNIEKIYLDAFKQTTTVNGQSYPQVNIAINERINTGCLIFNYTGHGNEDGLAAEGVIKSEDINSWKNGARLPLFITATCEFSRFDDVEQLVASKDWTGIPSGGEKVLFNKDGGGIALMSTTRVVYSAPNYDLNRNIFSCAFRRDKAGNVMTFGDIIKTAKNNSGSGANKRNFTLLGDPALKLSYPYQGKVVTDSINSVSVFNYTDSLKALSLITISGHVQDNSGHILNNFNGVVSPIVYDKPTKIRTLANDGGQSMTFNLSNNILFSGKTMAKDGFFRFTFIVPKDIDYTYGSGKISYYANNETEDMNGSFGSVIVGGFSNALIPDNDGPAIKLYINDTLFREGGLTDSNPRLLAILNDRDGINTTGSGIGHDITGFLDNQPDKSFVLNNYYEADFDNYMQGRINYDLSGLSEGVHYLTIKAWDNFNNSSEKTISFKVMPDNKFIISKPVNYPNPFFYNTSITLQHNRPDEQLEVRIAIYSIDGRIIRTLERHIEPTGYTLPPVDWDGNEQGGRKAGKGVYLYTVTVITTNGETARTSGRMIIL
jgi:hypothetical protein